MLAQNWHLGLTSSGGPAVRFRLFQQLFIDKYKWVEPTIYQEISRCLKPGADRIFATKVRPWL
jgi:chromate transport protein ChrA